MLYEYYCHLCDKYFEKSAPATQRHNVYCCGKKAVKLISICNTHKDRAYSFTTDMFDGKHVEVRSKEHYKGLLKQYGIADASPKEGFDQAKRNARSNEISRQVGYKKRAKVIAGKFKSAGVVKEAGEILRKLEKPKGGRNGKR